LTFCLAKIGKKIKALTSKISTIIEVETSAVGAGDAHASSSNFFWGEAKLIRFRKICSDLGKISQNYGEI